MAPLNRGNNYYQSMDATQLEVNRATGEGNRGNLGLFYLLVNTGGSWDYKNNAEGRKYYFYDGELITAEDFGNRNYGDSGTAFGIGEDILTDAAGANQIHKANKQNNGPTLSNWAGNFDDPRDTENILKGISTYRDAGRANNSVGYANVSNNLYNSTGTAGLVKGLSAVVAGLKTLIKGLERK